MAKKFIPPILLEARDRVRAIRDRSPEWQYLPHGWLDGGCPSRGWNDPSILAAQQRKWSTFGQMVTSSRPLGIRHDAIVLSDDDVAVHSDYMTYAYVLALTARNKSQVSLLDWGGGLGHFYLVARALIPDLEIDYHCKDVPLLCQGGSELLPQAHFYPDEEMCFQRDYDLVMASNSLQYVQEWRNTAGRLAAAARTYLYITNLPTLRRADSFTVMQRPYRYGYDTEYGCWFLNRDEFLEYMQAQGLELLREFLTLTNVVVPDAPEQAQYRGFLFRPCHGPTPASRSC